MAPVNDSRRENNEQIVLQLQVAGNPSASITLAEDDTIPLPTDWSAIDLGTLGANPSVATALNNLSGSLNQITGYSRYTTQNSNDRAFRYQNGVLAPLATTGYLWSKGYAINDLGWVAGQYWPNNGICGCAYLWSGSGPLVALESWGGEAVAQGLNNAGSVGGSAVVFGLNFPPNGAWRAVRWTPPLGNGGWTKQDLGTLAQNTFGLASYGYAMNQLGEVAGKAMNDDGVFRAFRTRPNDVIDPETSDVGTLAGSQNLQAQSEALDVNDLGEVVGTSQDASLRWHAFQGVGLDIVGGGKLHDLGLGSTTAGSAYARAINNRGIMVGKLGGTTALWWNDGSLVEASIEKMLTNKDGWVFVEVYDINDDLRIVGWGYHYSVARAFLMFPGLDH